MSPGANRQDMRAHFDQSTRIALLEQDADRSEREDKAMRAEMDRRFDRLETLIKGVLATLATGAVMLAIDIVLRASGAN